LQLLLLQQLLLLLPFDMLVLLSSSSETHPHLQQRVTCHFSWEMMRHMSQVAK